MAELALPDHALGIGQPAAGGLTSSRTRAASACLAGERFGGCPRLPLGVGKHVRLRRQVRLQAALLGVVAGLANLPIGDRPVPRLTAKTA